MEEHLKISYKHHLLPTAQHQISQLQISLVRRGVLLDRAAPNEKAATILQ